MTTEEATELRFAVLGPVRLWRGGQEIATGSPQQQAVLGALLLARGRAVSITELIRVVWGEEPPATALGTVRTYISRMRRLLEGTRARIDAVAGGYVLRDEGLRVDAWDVQSALNQVTGSAADPIPVLADALAAWSGPALEGVPGTWAQAQRVRLNDLRVAATEALIRSRLREAGPSAREVDDLTGLVQENPLNEDLRALLMLALHHQGRRAQALEVFHTGRHLLREELGLSPGPTLHAAQEQILRDDENVPARPPARQVTYLPVVLADFVGRRQALAELESALTGPGAVAGIAGMGGSGRSSLAVLAAHRLAPGFSGGQVYVDLAGPGGLDGVLEQLLRLMGADLSALPGREARAAELNTLASGERLLLVVENVSSLEQLQLLRQALPSAALLFTSLRQVHGMADVTWVRLQPLSHSESLELFAAVAGPERVAQETQACRELAALSGGYALAVRVFAQRVRDLPRWNVSAITQNMREEMAHPFSSGHADCDLLAAPVERTYSVLDPEAARIIRMLGLLPDQEYSAARIADLLRIPVHQVFFAAAACIDVSLLRECATEHHYRLSDPVVRTVMMRLAHATDGAREVARVQADHASDRLCAPA
ncbi:hypothetical protein Kisp01_41870 [Kineosporia sp. NBRC 101677]|uniref:AfsR/SARP family transcriptional regulator n=1 Tax=Kineosporia sp. NBRC 101677 TaxID=3032197 RepID=UPI0024A2CA5C|nr:BTAD domain-containing putative transcriptional regulator [Kineosporia sp. NBRC 101677]GLY17172.1 hypothetical protein Kisp01_41870 [Kineosporia sp. NBRC 101677]